MFSKYFKMFEIAAALWQVGGVILLISLLLCLYLDRPGLWPTKLLWVGCALVNAKIKHNLCIFNVRLSVSKFMGIRLFLIQMDILIVDFF